jgi:hypothetical protein
VYQTDKVWWRIVWRRREGDRGLKWMKERKYISRPLALIPFSVI